ncbi:hypothetical protein ABZX69_13740 [Streptomyces sp. NPDC004074]
MNDNSPSRLDLLQFETVPGLVVEVLAGATRHALVTVTRLR